MKGGSLIIAREYCLTAGFGKAVGEELREGHEFFVRMLQSRGEHFDIAHIIRGKRAEGLVFEPAGRKKNGDADHDENSDRAGHGDEAGDDGVGGAPEFLRRAGFFLFLENGDEGGGERALAEEASGSSALRRPSVTCGA
jgi:hypothetical protein